jgi:integrase
VSRGLAEWIDDLESQVRSGDRSGNYVREIKRWTKPGRHGYIALLGDRSIHSIDRPGVRQWQRHLSDEFGLSGKTLWNVTAGLSAFLGWLRTDGGALHASSEFKVPWPRYDEHAPQIVRPELQERILGEIPEADRGAFLAMAFLGLRHSEAWVIDGTDYRDGRVWIRRARKGRKLDDPVRAPKNRQPRPMPVPVELAEWIEANVPKRVLLEGGTLFPNPRTGKAWTPTSFRRAWESACKRGGLPVLKAYETLRHSTATEWLRAGASEREVQALLGHKTGHATPRYARLAQGRLDEIVGRRGATPKRGE